MISRSRKLPCAAAIQMLPSMCDILVASITVREEVRPPLPTLPPHSTIQLPYSHNYFFPIPDMSPSPSESFQLLFEAALQDYEKQTGMKLIDHPLARRLETCDSVYSITSILQEQAQAFRDFRGDDGKVMKSLKCAVHVLYTLSNSTALGEGIGLVRPNALVGSLCPQCAFHSHSPLQKPCLPLLPCYSR